MCILLVESLTEFDQPPIFPLGLSYIAANLNGEEKIFDMNVADEPYGDLAKELKRIYPKVVGISLRNIKVADPGIHHSSFAPHERAIKVIKKTVPNVLLITGGPAFSLYAEEMMKRLPEIDFGIFGEGEQSFPELLNNLNQPESIRGVYYRRDGKLLFTDYRDWIPSDKIGSPRRDLLDMKRYVDIPYAIGVQTKRGCILKCIHCSDRYLLGQNIRLRNPVEVVDEIEQLEEEARVKTFSFVDQIFNIPMGHAREICQEIIRRKLSVKWTAWFNEKYINEDFLKIVKAAGCTYLSFSPDSASDKVLRNLKKNFTTRELSRTYKFAKIVGMKAEYSFMVNAPGESILTLFETFIFVLKARLVLGKNLMLHNLLMTTPIRIYPHTEIKEFAVKKGIIDRKDDLVEPFFYNPEPLKYIVDILGLCSRIVWRMKEIWGKVTSRR